MKLAWCKYRSRHNSLDIGENDHLHLLFVPRRRKAHPDIAVITLWDSRWSSGGDESIVHINA